MQVPFKKSSSAKLCKTLLQ